MNDAASAAPHVLWASQVAVTLGLQALPLVLYLHTDVHPSGVLALAYVALSTYATAWGVYVAPTLRVNERVHGVLRGLGAADGPRLGVGHVGAGLWAVPASLPHVLPPDGGDGGAADLEVGGRGRRGRETRAEWPQAPPPAPHPPLHRTNSCTCTPHVHPYPHSEACAIMHKPHPHSRALA